MLIDKSKEHIVSSSEIAAVIEKGPDYASQKFEEFLKDIENISDSICNLYHDGDNSIIFALFVVGKGCLNGEQALEYLNNKFERLYNGTETN